MRFLVDANVLSEPTRPTPDARVVDWLRANEAEIAIDPIVLGEVRYGILLLPAGQRRARLEEWFDAGILRVRCVPWDQGCGLRWASLIAKLRADGVAMPVKDSMIAATALTHGLVLVTHNLRDFEKSGVGLFDPFA